MQFFTGGDLNDDDHVSVNVRGLNRHDRDGRQVLMRLLYGCAGLLLVDADDLARLFYAEDQLPAVGVGKCGDVFRDVLRGGDRRLESDVLGLALAYELFEFRWIHGAIYASSVRIRAQALAALARARSAERSITQRKPATKELACTAWVAMPWSNASENTTPKAAMASSAATREAALLMPEAAPAWSASMAFMTAVVSGAAAMVMPAARTTDARKKVGPE